MANHYRKLLNVKPRVKSGAAPTQSKKVPALKRRPRDSDSRSKINGSRSAISDSQFKINGSTSRSEADSIFTINGSRSGVTDSRFKFNGSTSMSGEADSGFKINGSTSRSGDTDSRSKVNGYGISRIRTGSCKIFPQPEPGKVADIEFKEKELENGYSVLLLYFLLDPRSTNENTNTIQWSEDQVRNEAAVSSKKYLVESSYLDFLMSVTEDIVQKEIYTNKGLKSLFQTHIENHKHLETDQMLFMLDRLRMDVGIPKDDSLNQLEFGYGSVKYSMGPFFFRQHATKNTFKGGFSASPKSNTKDEESASDVSIVELHRRPNFNSDDDSISCKSKDSISSSNTFYENDNRMYSDDLRASKLIQYEVTESEIKRALYQVGFDVEFISGVTSALTASSKEPKSAIQLENQYL